MEPRISGTLLLDPEIIDDPYPFYGQLRALAPVWEIPGTGLYTVSTFDRVTEATGRVEPRPSSSPRGAVELHAAHPLGVR